LSDSTEAENRYPVIFLENASRNYSLSNPETETALAIQINFSPWIFSQPEMLVFFRLPETLFRPKAKC
jgi:hypothetical protein